MWRRTPTACAAASSTFKWKLVQTDARIAYGAAASLAADLATAVGALPIFTARKISQRAQDSMLGFGAGAMLFVILREIIPESHRHGHEQAATLGVTGGFVTMLLRDTALG
jgi:ZIP family zinc transporter